MKKLSIEEKATRYDEAIKVANKYKDIHIMFHQIKDEIFPELKESEDEKIRKALIRFHKSTIDVDGVKGEDIIAWLERQSNKVDATLPESKNSKDEEIRKNLLNLIENIDEKILNINHLYKTEVRVWLKKQDEQKPAEWSEEDEKIALSIEQVMNCASLLNIVPEKVDKIRTWLKSLRPQNKWKPSDEQIEILDMVLTNESMDDNIARILRELREQLKKLKG